MFTVCWWKEGHVNNVKRYSPWRSKKKDETRWVVRMYRAIHNHRESSSDYSKEKERWKTSCSKMSSRGHDYCWKVRPRCDDKLSEMLNLQTSIIEVHFRLLPRCLCKRYQCSSKRPLDNLGPRFLKLVLGNFLHFSSAQMINWLQEIIILLLIGILCNFRTAMSVERPSFIIRKRTYMK